MDTFRRGGGLPIEVGDGFFEKLIEGARLDKLNRRWFSEAAREGARARGITEAMIAKAIRTGSSEPAVHDKVKVTCVLDGTRELVVWLHQNGKILSVQWGGDQE